MTSVGVRELKNNLSRYLEVVREGGELMVTEHGRPVARVLPIGARSGAERLSELIAAGDVTPSRRRERSLPTPIRLPGAASVSDLVGEQRR